MACLSWQGCHCEVDVNHSWAGLGRVLALQPCNCSALVSVSRSAVCALCTASCCFRSDTGNEEPPNLAKRVLKNLNVCISVDLSFLFCALCKSVYV